MKSATSYKFIITKIAILSLGLLVGCTAPGPDMVPTAIAKSTTIVTETRIPSPTTTVTPEPSRTPTVLPPVYLPTHIISSKNIDHLQQLDARELAGKPTEFHPRGMAFTPDGHLITGISSTIVYVWDGVTGQLIDSFDHSVYLWNVAISPDGNKVASGDDRGGVKIWDLKTGDNLDTLAHYNTIWSLAFSAESTMLASGSLEQEIKLWDLPESKELDHITDIPLESLAFSPDGILLAIA